MTLSDAEKILFLDEEITRLNKKIKEVGGGGIIIQPEHRFLSLLAEAKSTVGQYEITSN